MRDALFALESDVALLHAEFKVGDGCRVRHHSDVFVVLVCVGEERPQFAGAAWDLVDEHDGHCEVGVVQTLAAILEQVFLDKEFYDLQPEQFGKLVYLFLGVH